MTYKELRVTLTVYGHFGVLRELVNSGKISAEDYNVIGEIMRNHIQNLIVLSDTAWKVFKAIVEDSRKVHYES